MNTLAPIEISHRPYGNSTKRFISDMEVGETRYAESEKQAMAIHIMSRIIGLRLTRRRLADGRYSVTRITEEEYQASKPAAKVKALIKEDPGITSAEIVAKLGISENTVRKILVSLWRAGEIRRRERAFTYFPL